MKKSWSYFNAICCFEFYALRSYYFLRSYYASCLKSFLYLRRISFSALTSSNFCSKSYSLNDTSWIYYLSTSWLFRLDSLNSANSASRRFRRVCVFAVMFFSTRYTSLSIYISFCSVVTTYSFYLSFCFKKSFTVVKVSNYASVSSFFFDFYFFCGEMSW